MQDLVGEMYTRFVGIVFESRKNVKLAGGRANTLEYWRTLAYGRIYTAQQALANGLVDGISYREEAVGELKSLAGLSQATVVEYAFRPRGILDLLGASAARASPKTSLGIGEWMPLLAPRVLVLWMGRN